MRAFAVAVVALTAGCRAPTVERAPEKAHPADAGASPVEAPFGRLRDPSGALDRPLHRTATGAALDDGTPILAVTKGALWPIDAAALPLADGAQIQLGDGRRWIRFAYSPSRNAPARPRWLMPAHSREEIDRRRALLESEAARLPRDTPIAAVVTKRMAVLATVSVAEGEFGGAATHSRDTAASLGIFQWAMARNASVDDASLSRFFLDLARRARSRDAHPAELNLYQDAWRQCRAAGLDVISGRLSLQGHAATGAELAQLLQPEMAKAPLRTYQLIAAVDWIERTAAQKLQSGATVGSLFKSDRALATAVLLGVNRPRYVLDALTRAITIVGPTDEPRLLWELRRQALNLYPKGDRERRAMRLLTSEPNF